MRRTVEIAGFGKITAEESTLNMISLWGQLASEKYNEEGATALAKQAKDIGVMIYKMLDKKGYYTNAE